MKNYFIGCAALAAAIGCTNTDRASTSDSQLPPLPHDIHSYAQPEEARVTNVSLDLTPDFTRKQIAGVAKLTIQRSAGADSVVLDVRDLNIRSVTDAKGSPLGFVIGTQKETFGAPLTVPAGKVARSTSIAFRPGLSCPVTLETICMTWE